MKKPSSAYVLWCKDRWAEVKKENPDAEFKEVSNILGSKWKNEGAGSIKDEKAIDNIHKHEALLMLKKKEKSEKIIKNKKKLKGETGAVDPNKPKRPASSFILFRACNDVLRFVMESGDKGCEVVFSTADFDSTQQACTHMITSLACAIKFEVAFGFQFDCSLTYPDLLFDLNTSKINSDSAIQTLQLI
ncbi:high mobility group B protein 6-like [Papaver somniferum]|uniref:high mobility group B protein 6-like n=1 Tax=Papaver somniferum TaxID=3469 RepID=UPI000E6FF5AA|nr:high mobility group B protein 6-like [Papaver somniferum]